MLKSYKIAEKELKMIEDFQYGKQISNFEYNY